jgi:hypothetical protein
MCPLDGRNDSSDHACNAGQEDDVTEDQVDPVEFDEAKVFRLREGEGEGVLGVEFWVAGEGGVEEAEGGVGQVYRHFE